MQKKKSGKKTNKKNVVRAIPKLESSSGYSWIWYLIGALIIIAALYFVYSSMTGNAVNIMTGNAADTKNSFKPIVDMISGLISNVYDALKGPLGMIVGETATGTASNELGANIFLAKVLLLILVLAIVSAVLSKTGFVFLEEGWTHWVVSIVVAILSVRFLNAELVQAILIPYSTLGVALTAIVPFAIYFLFVEKGMYGPHYSMMRRVAWIFFAVIFLAIWTLRTGEKTSNSIIDSIYPLTALIAVIMAFADGTIQKIFATWAGARTTANARGTMIAHHSVALKKLQKAHDDGHYIPGFASTMNADYNASQGFSVVIPTPTLAQIEKAYLQDINALNQIIVRLQ